MAAWDIRKPQYHLSILVSDIYKCKTALRLILLKHGDIHAFKRLAVLFPVWANLLIYAKHLTNGQKNPLKRAYIPILMVNFAH